MTRGSILAALVLGGIVQAGCGGSTRPGSLRAAPHLPALAVYRIDVQQGNVVTPDMLAGLHPGMERERVRLVMGTPQLADPFHPDRWDYLYSERRGYDLREQRTVSLYFNGDRLDRVEGDVVATPGARYRQLLAANLRTNINVPPAPPPPKGLAERVGRQLGLVEPPPPAGYDLGTYVATDEAGVYRNVEGRKSERTALGPRPGGPTFVKGEPVTKDADEADRKPDDGPEATQEEPGLFDGLLDRIGL